MKRTLITSAIIAGALTLAVVGGAQASSLIHNSNLATGSVNGRTLQNGAVHNADLTGHLSTLIHAKSTVPGPRGAKGATGASGLEGAYRAVAVYDNGGNGWATVACNNETDFAIDGQIEAGDAPGNSGPIGSYVIASFQGRMNWDTNSPKDGRTDGWVFGIHADANGASDTPLIVSAICVPGLAMPSTVNHY